MRVVAKESFLREISGCAICSFWGHGNTLAAAGAFAGFDLTPRVVRPVLTLSARGLPTLDGAEFDTCWILTPVYAENFRPAIGEEIGADAITEWKIVKMKWRMG